MVPGRTPDVVQSEVGVDRHGIVTVAAAIIAAIIVTAAAAGRTGGGPSPSPGRIRHAMIMSRAAACRW